MKDIRKVWNLRNCNNRTCTIHDRLIDILKIDERKAILPKFVKIFVSNTLFHMICIKEPGRKDMTIVGLELHLFANREISGRRKEMRECFGEEFAQ